MKTKISLPDLVEKELETLRREAEQNLRELAEERKKLSLNFNEAITDAIRDRLT